MVQHKAIEERLQLIEEYLLEIKSMLKPAVTSSKKTNEQDDLMNVKDAAKLAKVDSAVIYAACKRNELPYILSRIP